MYIPGLFNARGEIVSFVDKATGREFAAGPMNRLLAFKDVPRLFDAWDVDSNYELSPLALDEPVTLTVRQAEGPRAVLHLERKILHSASAQDIVLAADGRRVDFVTTVDWHELHRLLKVEFPVSVQASEGINEIQFGYLKRPTHRSRLYDSDRFEVCNQRYSALCDESHGAAVLNDCKYGISMKENALQLTLLRAPAAPEMRADNGVHHFTYAFCGWEGPFLSSPVVREAYDLNVPLTTELGSCADLPAASQHVIPLQNQDILYSGAACGNCRCKACRAAAYNYNIMMHHLKSSYLSPFNSSEPVLFLQLVSASTFPPHSFI